MKPAAIALLGGVAVAVVGAGCIGEPPSAPDDVAPRAITLVRGSVSAIPDDFRFHPVKLVEASLRDAPISDAADDGVAPLAHEIEPIILPFSAKVSATPDIIDVDIVLQFSADQDASALALPEASEGPFELLLTEASSSAALPPNTLLDAFTIASPAGPRFALGSDVSVNIDAFNPAVFDFKLSIGDAIASGVGEDGVSWTANNLDVERSGATTSVAPGEHAILDGAPPVTFENIATTVLSSCSGCATRSTSWLVTRGP